MKKINVSQIDTLFVNGSYPIEFLFYYKHKIKTLPIRKAIKKLSSSFWPLFGKYNDGLIQSSKYSEDKFYCETIHNEDFTPMKNEMQLWEKYNLVNPKKMEGLLFLSILQFNNGTVIIPKMNHLAGDGYSYLYFMSVLASVSKSSYMPFKKYAIRLLASPRLKRTVLKEYHFNKTKIEEPFEHQNCTIKLEQVPKTYVKEEIEKIKTKYSVSVSTNDILSAIVFKKTFEKQKAQIDNQFTLSIPIDVRRQVKELGPKFFGNGIMLHHLNLSIDELDKIDNSELALKLRKSMPSVNTEMYVEYLSDLESKIERSSIHSLKPYDPEKGCLVTNLSRMPIQKLNFGSGNPALIFPLTIGRNSAGILADKDNFLLRLVSG
jgi:hypothetical protein